MIWSDGVIDLSPFKKIVNRGTAYFLIKEL